MNKHTPGPWSVQYNDGMSADIVGAHERVAITYATENQSHNARLIAAAPEMYEALQAIIAAKEEGFPEALQMGRTAIAKAEGRS
jgi:hypothetical protein